jgi:hypothetical protein
MTRILFSLPVHERPDIVEGQLANIRYFCPDSIVCLHVSLAYKGDFADFTRFAQLPGVLVNPHRLASVYGTGLFHLHVANYIHAKQYYPEVDRVGLIASNELLVRPGLEAHVQNYAAGAQVEALDRQTDWHLFHRKVEQDPKVMALLSHFGLPTVFGGQAEGQFYEDGMFVEMAKAFVRFFPLEPYWFETEELLPQTMMMALLNRTSRVSPPFTLQNYSHAFEINEPLIAQIRRGHGYIFAPRHPQRLRSVHMATDDLSSVFSVKRVPREACALRDHIYSLQQAQS